MKTTGVKDVPKKILLVFLGHPNTHHILLDSVHPVLELVSGRVHVCNHCSDVANDGGEDEHSHEEVDGDEGVPGGRSQLRALRDHLTPSCSQAEVSRQLLSRSGWTNRSCRCIE